MTARYGDFLRSSLPPFWTTADPALVRGALARLAAASDAARRTPESAATSA
jgi:ATP-dependent DNA helicase DinG